MGINMKMYNELSLLRQRLKEEGKKLQGRTPLICTDEALYKMVELCPKKISDFQSVPGVGETFIENYAKSFLEVIRKYEVTNTEKTVKMDPSVVSILKELEKKLVRINRRNRLLYMPKATNKYAVDLFSDSINPLDIIFNEKSVTVCDILNASEEMQAETSKYRKFVQLLREVNKDLRDKGQNDLYIGYPFVIGRMVGENFNVRAPLALFPVIAERTSTKITLKLDESRDALYNNTLVLAHYKFNGINNPLPSEVIEDIEKDTFLQNLISFYSDNGINLTASEDCVRKFMEYKAEEFPKFKTGELQIENNVVIGKYPVCENSIQKDFNEILKNNEINTLLNNLLIDSNEINYDEEYYNGENEIKIDDKSLKISEQNLVYINPLNSSQEAVLASIKSRDELVVQGPPGTGKSQVITSLISDFVSEDKTVLMVSEKKTALDVVYSRLGNLSKYALIIDDVGDKELFYSQLQKMVNLEASTQEKLININEVSTKIDVLIKRLEVIAEKLYMCDDFGIEPYKVYQKNRKIDLANEEEKNKMFTINSALTPEVKVMNYPILEKLHETFSNIGMTEKLEKYSEIVEKFPWLLSMAGNMTEYEVVSLEEKLNEIKNETNQIESLNIFAKIFAKRKICKKINENFKKHFYIAKKELHKLLLIRTNDVIESTKFYSNYQELKTIYDKLSQDEIAYYNVLLKIKKNLNYKLEEANNDLFNQLLYIQIQKFEVNNRELFQDINDFDSIIRSISLAINQKQELTKKRLEEILKAEMHEINMSKRKGEIFRALESKRKWSVNKFIKKFDFELFKSIKIWLLTPEVVSEIIPLQTGVFDLVIFDEASQMFIEKGIPSILRAKKVVIAGDHKQLRPTNLGAGRIEFDEEGLQEDEEIAAAIEEESLLDLARFKYRDVLLNFHYRSKYEELIAFSNYAFYNGRLYVSPNNTSNDVPPIEVHKIENGMWTNRANIEEARYIIELLKKFFEERTADETIGIITFNISQRDLIEDLIEEECVKSPEFAAKYNAEIIRKKDGQDIGLFIKNIESVQGDERDVIIFSIGYAKNENGRIVRNFGWLNQKGGENRLNVAISRAKQKIHIVTSINPSELQVDDVKNDGPRFLKKYLEYTFAVSNKDKESAKQILLSFGDEKNPGQNITFDSIFENQVYDALIENGFEVDTQVGIGGYRIDLAIKKNGKYVLGIECDGRLYHSLKSARERDYHRQKYLESRGWKIYRIWSTNWWKNPKQEIVKITNLIENICK